MEKTLQWLIAQKEKNTPHPYNFTNTKTVAKKYNEFLIYKYIFCFHADVTSTKLS